MEQVENNAPWERRTVEKVLMATVREQRRARRWNIFFKLVILAFILFFIASWYRDKPQVIHKEHVALIDMIGVIGEGQQIDADVVATSLRKAFEEPKAKGLLLRINSPGGSPVQSAYIYDEIRRLKGLHPDKKVYAVCMDSCASGGYYIATSADEIYANGSSLVGSIGVLLPGFGFEETMKKVGATQRSVTAGNNKLFLDPFSPVVPSQVEHAKSMLNAVHEQFINAVKEGRGTRLKENDEMFSGLVWTGSEALKLGLIDGLGSAGYVAREIFGTEEIVDYSATHNLLERLASRLGASMGQELSEGLGASMKENIVSELGVDGKNRLR